MCYKQMCLTEEYLASECIAPRLPSSRKRIQGLGTFLDMCTRGNGTISRGSIEALTQCCSTVREVWVYAGSGARFLSNSAFPSDWLLAGSFLWHLECPPILLPSMLETAAAWILVYPALIVPQLYFPSWRLGLWTRLGAGWKRIPSWLLTD